MQGRVWYRRNHILANPRRWTDAILKVVFSLYRSVLPLDWREIWRLYVELHADTGQNKLETKASSHERQCIPAGSSVCPPRRVLITVSIITMRSRLFPANTAHPAALQNFERNFANLVAPPTDGSANCLERYKVYLLP